MKTIDLGLIPYSEAYTKQKEAVEARKKDSVPDTLLIAEHPAVFTMGRTGSRDNLLVDEEVLRHKSISLIDVDRGGDITFHGPGQIVLYPIIDLKVRGQDLYKYIRDLEECVIDFLATFDIKAHRIEGQSGVWVNNRKIGFVGIGVSKWVSFHGISININTDLSYFSMIRSCGIQGVEITSLSKIKNEPVSISNIKEALIASFKAVFGAEDAVANISAVA